MHKDLLEVEKKCYLQALKQADPKKLKKIEEDFKVKYAYDTVYISGNSITLEEAYNLDKESLKERVSEREQKEFSNHIKAYDFVMKNINKREVDEDFIKDIHQILLEDISPGGLYRQVNVRLVGLHQPPDYIKVYDRMKRMMNNLENNEFNGDTIEKAAFILLTISKIYPFISGNGRLGRLLMNYYLVKDGYIAISVDKENRQKYYEAIDDFKVNKTMDKMVALIKELLLKQYTEINEQLE